ncbi:hypothetical protein Tco_0845962, partial [Tanacetum coccineum]
MGTTRVIVAEGTEGSLNLGPERPRVYSNLSQDEKDRYNADIQATNIILQGLPKDIYSLINHYTDAKDIWDNVKMLLEGSELTKEDRESQLYDEFKHFCQNKGETIHDYYGKENGVNILKSIDEGPFSVGTTRGIIAVRKKVHLNLGPEDSYPVCNEAGPSYDSDNLSEDIHDAIERKNLLLEHDNIIADGLSKEVFYVASNSELNVSRFTKMQKAHNVVKACYLELEAELSNLRDNIHKDNYNELLNWAERLFRSHNLTEKLMVFKTQNGFLGVENERLSSIQVKPKVLAPGKYVIDVEPIPPRNKNNREVHLVYLRHLKESVDTLREIVKEAKVERPLDRSLAFACRYTKHSQELFEYVFGTCPK